MTDPANLDVQAIIKEMEKFHPLVLEVCVNLQEDGRLTSDDPLLPNGLQLLAASTIP